MLKRNIIANYLGTSVTVIMGVVFVPLYLDLLGPGSFGLIGVFAILMAAMPVFDLGLASTLTREMARFSAGCYDVAHARSLLRSFEMVCFGLAAALALAVWVLSGFLAVHWFSSETVAASVVAKSLALAGLVCAGRLCEGLYRGGLNGLQRQVLGNGLGATVSILRGAGAVAVLWWISPTIEAYFLWNVAVSLGSVAVFALTLHNCIPRNAGRVAFSLNPLLAVRSYASGMLVISLLALLLTQADKVILSKLLTLDEYAYYALAAMLSGAITMAVAPVVQAVFPRLIEAVAREDLTAQSTLYHQAAQVLTVLLAPMAAVMVLLPWGVIWAWTGDASVADRAAPILGPLSLGAFFNALMWVPYHSQLAHGWTSLTVTINSLAVAILIPAIIITVPEYGAVGAAYIWVILNAGYLLIGIPFMHRKILRNDMRDWYIRDLALPIIGAAIPVLIVALALRNVYFSRLAWTCVCLGSGLLGAFLALFAAPDVKKIVLRQGLISRAFGR